jgi:hypothetical protein
MQLKLLARSTQDRNVDAHIYMIVKRSHRWFVGLGIDDPVWDAAVFTKNRDRLLEGRWRRSSWPRCSPTARSSRCCRAIDFSVDGTLVEA